MSDIALLVLHPGGGAGRYLVCARNLSAGGIACIHGGYIHPGSECKVVLPRRDGTPLAAAGVIVHCRHVEGPYHEVGIRFNQELDPMPLLPDSPVEAQDVDPTREMPAFEGSVLVVDASAPGRKMLGHMLGLSGLSLTVADAAAAAADALRKREYQLVISALPVEEAIRLIQQIRKGGSKGRVVAITAENGAARVAALRSAGADEVVGRAGSPAYLAVLLAEWLAAAPIDRPIHSAIEERPGMRQLVADFIDEAQRKANQVEKSIGAETGNPREACLELLGAAPGFGFDALTEAARDALTALDTTERRTDAEGALWRLVAICRRMRCATTVRPGLAA